MIEFYIAVGLVIFILWCAVNINLANREIKQGEKRIKELKERNAKLLQHMREPGSEAVEHIIDQSLKELKLNKLTSYINQK